jgi:sugar lactone lactonase YvrE
VIRLCSFALPLLMVTTSVSATSAIPTIPTMRPPPTSGVVAAADGTVYFVDSFRSTVWRVPPGGAPVAFVTGRNGRMLQLDDDGSLCGTHHDANRELVVWCADPDGRVTEVARPELPAQYGSSFVLQGGRLIGVSGLSRRSGVHLWRADEHERHVLAGGEWGVRDGAAAHARFLPIGGMTRAADGALLVTSGSTVRRVAPDGSVTTLSAGERLLRPRHSLLTRLVGEVPGHLTGIAEAANGEIYVANPGRGAVVRIDAEGRADDIVTTGGGWSPTGVATAAGYIYVLEYGPGVRVRRIVPGGETTVVALVRSERAYATLGARLTGPG